MGGFRRVEAEQAGPAALGILIPPAARTFVIVRPRALPWDLLLCRDTSNAEFAQLAHDEATAAAQALYRALRAWAAGGAGDVESVAQPDGCRLHARIGPFVLAVCPRMPGRPYAPLVVVADEVAAVRAALLAALRPGVGVEQEVYFNTRFFERSPD
ncbi:MAG: hypothetical protein U0736_09975 [Gemmataceae bacterium]